MPDKNETVTPQSDSESNSGIDWTKIDVSAIPFDVLKEHPKYQEQRQEAITRRQELRDLKAQLESQEVPDPQPTGEKESDSPNAQLLDVIKQLQNEIKGIKNETSTEKRKSYITKKLAEAKLPEDKIARALRLIDQPGLDTETIDARIEDYMESGNWKVQEGDADVVNPDGDQRTSSSVMSRVDLLIGGNANEVSIFDASEQSRARGGAILRN